MLRARRAHTRGIIRGTVLLLALYLAVDVATPLLPGAFRFDPLDSIDAAGRTGLPVMVSAPPARSDRLLVAPDEARPQLRGPAIRPTARRFVPVLHLPDRGGSPNPSEDA